ncbi:unnamed protein product [Linum trigynum]|uniref:UTP23 sensor motif region domain-containing protein n=1 Tax=Linum trigynum TaxID=586398 RepID=A0AAV2G4A2_9ROSI
MKVKKQKRHRRAVRFFTAVFGFRQPYKVFCDGTFIHHLIANRVVPADTAISTVLGGPVKLFTSRCVVEELKRLGHSYSESLEASQKLMTARCDHEGKKSAKACLIDIVGENNPEHFFVATQDADLRKKFQEVPGVPLVYGLRNALFLEQPSTFQHEFAKSSEARRSKLSDQEREALIKETGHILETAEVASADELEGPKHDVRNKGLNVKDRPQFKRKRAKGPNPLSCLKKKNINQAASVSKGSNASDSSEVNRSRSRKRPEKKERGGSGCGDLLLAVSANLTFFRVETYSVMIQLPGHKTMLFKPFDRSLSKNADNAIFRSCIQLGGLIRFLCWGWTKQSAESILVYLLWNSCSVKAFCN